MLAGLGLDEIAREPRILLRVARPGFDLDAGRRDPEIDPEAFRIFGLPTDVADEGVGSARIDQRYAWVAPGQTGSRRQTLRTLDQRHRPACGAGDLVDRPAQDNDAGGLEAGGERGLREPVLQRAQQQPPDRQDAAEEQHRQGEDGEADAPSPSGQRRKGTGERQGQQDIGGCSGHPQHFGQDEEHTAITAMGDMPRRPLP